MLKENRNWIVSISLVISSLFGQVLLLILTGVLANKNVAIKKNVYYTNIVNNMVLILSGILFCVNIIVNIFIQMETSNSATKPPPTILDELMFTSELSKIK